MTTFPDVIKEPIPRDREVQRWSDGFWRCLVFCSLFSVIFLPEFARNGIDNPVSPIYEKAVGGFRFIDLAILAMVFSHVVALGCLRHKTTSFPRALAWPGGAFFICIVTAAVHGATGGGTRLFFDWRGLALGIGLFFVWEFWLQSELEIEAGIRLLAAYMAARIALLFGLYLAGYHDTLLGITIPIFDGPTVSAIVFAALLALQYCQQTIGRVERVFWFCLAGAASLLVVLCFRRTYWGELALGSVILLLLRKHHLIRNFVLLGLVCAGMAFALGNSFVSRLQSMDVSREDTQFSADNSDHLNDLADAWEQIRQSPIVGIGLGTSYPTWQIRSWKPESVMVHNAALHVWLKYGLAGLLCYLWFHIELLAWLNGRAKNRRLHHHAFFGAAFAYLAAQFVMTLSFAPWPYSELQLTTLISFIVAAAVMSDQPSLRLGRP